MLSAISSSKVEATERQWAEPAPHNVAAEQELLGAILNSSDAFALVADIATAEHFFEPIHGEIFRVLADRIGAGHRVNPITVKSFLPAVDIAGMPMQRYLVRLAEEATAVVSLRDHAALVRDLAVRRELIDCMAHYDTRLRAVGAADSAEKITVDMQADIDVLNGRAAGSIARSITIGQAADEAISAMSEAMARGGGISGLTSGLATLDHKTDGLHRGDLIIGAGRPGMGKSALAMSCALRQAAVGLHILFFSLEMSARALAMRALSDLIFDPRAGSADYRQLSTGHVDDQQAMAAAEAARDLRKLPLIIEEQAGLTVQQVALRARRHRDHLARGGEQLDVVYIDHIHILRPEDRYRGNRTEELTEISSALKALAKDLDVPVVALAQLNRAVEGRDDKRPTMSDLRDSGSIEQDADLVMLIFREEYYLARMSCSTPAEEDRRVARLHEVRNRLELIVAKQRNGPVGPVTVFFDAARNAVRDLAEGR